MQSRSYSPKERIRPIVHKAVRTVTVLSWLTTYILHDSEDHRNKYLVAPFSTLVNEQITIARLKHTTNIPHVCDLSIDNGGTIYNARDDWFL